MGTEHVVEQGQHLALIARQHGFPNWEPIWNAPENASLRDERKNPNILLPGDVLFIPDKVAKEESRATEKRHKFVVQGQKLTVRIALHGLDNKPLGGHECALVVGTDTKEFATGSDGILEREIPADADAGTLIDGGPPPSAGQVRVLREIPFRIGRLDPATEVSGEVARLNNLGYTAGDVPDHALSVAEADEVKASITYRSAVEEFQCDFKLKIDGVCGRATQAKLVEVHGC